MRKLLHHIWHLPRKCIALLITGYQYTLSPDHGPLRGLYPYGVCKHEPTCSEYARQQILKRGVVAGMAPAIWQIVRCTPWAKPTEEKLAKLAAKASQ